MEIKQTYIDKALEINHTLQNDFTSSQKESDMNTYLIGLFTDMGLKVERMSDTAFAAVLETSQLGETFVFRTPLDVSSIQIASWIQTITYLVDKKEAFSGDIYFVFETSKDLSETTAYIEGKNPAAIYDNHLEQVQELKHIRVEMIVHGQAGHGSRPDLAASPIFASANIIATITTLWPNRLDVTKVHAFSLDHFHSGTAENIIPPNAKIEGSIWFYDPDEGEKALQLIQDTAIALAPLHKCTVEFSTETGLVTLPSDVSNQAVVENAIQAMLAKTLSILKS